jgi:hypothetical protein
VASEEQEERDPYEYAPFEKWEYRPVLFKTDNTRTWLGVREGFYEASLTLVHSLARGKLSEDLEGVAAIFLFRHYLELSLKRIIIEGRWLKSADKNARKSEVEILKPEHRLRVLWEMMITDAKPKIGSDTWKKFDLEFVKRCVDEFDSADMKGIAFRYDGVGGENYLVSFLQLSENMVHVHQVFEGIISYLVETYGMNAEWEEYVDSF